MPLVTNEVADTKKGGGGGRGFGVVEKAEI